MTPASNAASYSRQPVRDYGKSVVCLSVCLLFEKSMKKRRTFSCAKESERKTPRAFFVEDSVGLAARARARSLCFTSPASHYASRENAAHHVARAIATRSWLRVVFRVSARRRMFVRGSKSQSHVIPLSKRSVAIENRGDIFGETALEQRGPINFVEQ